MVDTYLALILNPSCGGLPIVIWVIDRFFEDISAPKLARGSHDRRLQ